MRQITTLGIDTAKQVFNSTALTPKGTGAA